MALNYVNLPIFEDADYEYSLSLERISVRIRLYFIERENRWAIDLRYGDRTPVVLGAALSPEYPLFLDYYLGDLTGFFWLEPIGKTAPSTPEAKFNLGSYYRLIYYYETEDNDAEQSTSEGSDLFSNCWRRGGCN